MTFSVLTPCYNSSALIHRVFTSLKKQTYRDFEWIIIDDGSTDQLEEIIETFRKEADFPIEYYRFNENRGKTSAFNQGVIMAHGYFLLSADADDEFLPETMEVFLKHWEGIPEERREQFSGIDCNCIDQDGNFVGTPFPESPWEADMFIMRYKARVHGEKWGIIRTDILRKFPFDTTIDKHQLLTTVWSKIAAEYKTLYINDTLRIYYRNQNNHESITSSLKKKISYPEGYRYSHLLNINNYFQYIKYYPKELFLDFVHYIRMSVHLKYPLKTIITDVKGLKKRLLLLPAAPVAIAVVLRDRLQGRV